MGIFQDWGEYHSYLNYEVNGLFKGEVYVLFNDSTNDGNNTKLDSIPKESVKATNPPSATVPPKLDNINTENPKNNTMEV